MVSNLEQKVEIFGHPNMNNGLNYCVKYIACLHAI